MQIIPNVGRIGKKTSYASDEPKQLEESPDI